MKKPLVPILVASLVASTTGAPTASAAAYVPIALRAAPAPAPAATPAATPAAPAEGESFEELVEQARGKFKDKDYTGAVALFERAYSIQPEPAILFNIGRIHEEANNVDAAIAYYEKFIADPNVDMGQRDKAMQRLQFLEKVVEIRKKEEAKRNPQPVKEPPKTDKPTDASGPQPGPQVQPGTDKPQQNKLLRPIGYAMFGTGAALVIGGAIAGGLAKRQHNAFGDAETLEARRDAAERGKGLAAAADGLFIAGGVLAAVGIILLVIPKSRKSKAAQAMRPRVSPEQVGLGYVYRF